MDAHPIFRWFAQTWLNDGEPFKIIAQSMIGGRHALLTKTIVGLVGGLALNRSPDNSELGGFML